MHPKRGPPRRRLARHLAVGGEPGSALFSCDCRASEAARSPPPGLPRSGSPSGTRSSAFHERCERGPREPLRAGTNGAAEYVVVDRLDLVEDRKVRRPRKPHTRPRGGQSRRERRLGLGEVPPGAADLGREQGAKVRRGGVKAEVGGYHTETGEFVGGQ